MVAIEPLHDSLLVQLVMERAKVTLTSGLLTDSI